MHCPFNAGSDSTAQHSPLPGLSQQRSSTLETHRHDRGALMAGSAGGMPWRTPREKLQMVAMSTATIGALYGSGYLIVHSPAIATESPSAVQQNLVPPAPANGYHDGRYTGTAENAFGAVSVAVTITSGRISAVEITDSTTYYS